MPTPYRKVFNILRALGLNESDIFADIGCGLGRVVFCASWLGTHTSIGVDINEILIASAEQARRSSKLKTRDIKFLCQPAQETDFDNITALYMFHPFGKGTMQEVMDRLDKSLEQNPRNFRLAYENPVNAAVIDQVAGLTQVDNWDANPDQGSKYAVTFWSTNSDEFP